MPAAGRAANMPKPGSPRRTPNRAAPPAASAATTSFIPRKSTVRRDPGLPAICSRISVLLRFWGLAIREASPESRPASGRSVRSNSGCWSSISSSERACIDPSSVSRACTGSMLLLPARPMKMSRTARPAMDAMRTGMSIGSDLYVDDFSDCQEADDHEQPAERQDDHADRDSEDLRRPEHGPEEMGRNY